MLTVWLKEKRIVLELVSIEFRWTIEIDYGDKLGEIEKGVKIIRASVKI